MTKHAWMVWAAPVAIWGVYMCWLSGYQNGYDHGHHDGWDRAAANFAPVNLVQTHQSGYVGVSLQGERISEISQ
ncbi:hypothetical protein GC163_20885 [bacterium]|nr:hypothetical protein [bacterium]